MLGLFPLWGYSKLHHYKQSCISFGVNISSLGYSCFLSPFFFFFFPLYMWDLGSPGWILVPQPGIEPSPPALKSQPRDHQGSPLLCVQLSLEQHRFELRRSTYTWMFSRNMYNMIDWFWRFGTTGKKGQLLTHFLLRSQLTVGPELLK